MTSKRLVAGDAFVFMRYYLLVGEFVLIIKCSNSFPKLLIFCSNRGDNGELRVGVRRAGQQQSTMPSSVISSQSMHLGVLATASHAVSTQTLFTVYYKPRSDIVIILVPTNNKVSC